ncbi:phage portal protein [Escherichia coli]|nr:phage portal protein [Escherichia coli]
MTAARIAAALGMYIRKGDGQSYEPDGNGSKENERELTIQPGIIYDDLKPGEEIGMVKSDRPNPNPLKLFVMVSCVPWRRAVV